MNTEYLNVKNNDDKVGCSQSFRFIRSMLGRGIKPEKILRQIKKKRYFESLYGSDERKALRDIWRVRRKLFNVEPKNKVEEIHPSDSELPEEILKTVEVFEKIRYKLNRNTLITLKTMHNLFMKDKKAILDYQCGSGKSTAGLIISATYASPENRIWLVTEKIETVGEYVKTLKALGANAVPWHGRPESCPVTRKDFMATGSKCCDICKNPCGAINKSTADNKWDCDADILVTTHKHWHSALEAEEIPRSVSHVIIDEAPALMEFMNIPEAEIRQLEDVFRFDHALQLEFKSDIGKIDRLLSEGDCKEIPVDDLYTVSREEQVMKYLKSNLHNHKLNHDETEGIFALLNFLKSKPVCGMIEYRNPNERKLKIYAFGRGKVNIRVPAPHIILDGSASLSDTEWIGFTIYQCSELEQHYPNTVIYTVRNNPSKKSLADTEKFAELERIVLEVAMKDPVEKEMILFSNKDLSKDKQIEDNIMGLSEKLKNLGVKLIPMKRGEHYGSNKGRNCHVNAICMSFFMSSSFYVLRTALSTNQEISAGRIWSNPLVSPAMKRNGGFRDLEIHKSYLRTIASDIYQTIMRGSIRDDSANPYLVVCMISNIELVGFFRKYFPQAEVVYPESELIKSIEEGETIAELIRKYPDKSRVEIENIVMYWNSVGKA